MHTSIEDRGKLYETSLKRVAGGGLLVFIGTIFAKITGFLRQFVIIHMLSPEQYGFFALGLSIMTVAAGLGNLGLYQGSQRFIAYYDSLGEKNKVKGTIWGTLKTMAISGFILLTVLSLLSKKISVFLDKPDFKVVLLIFGLTVPFAMYSHIFVSFFLGFRRADIAVLLSDFLFGILSVSFIACGLLVNRRTEVAVIAFAMAMFIQFLVSVIIFQRVISHRIAGADYYPLTMRLLRFSLPLFFSGVSFMILNNTDTLMLGYFASSEQVGFYNAAFLLMAFLAVFLNSFAVVFMPVLTGLIAREAAEEAENLYQLVTKWIFVTTAPMVITFFFFPSRVLTLLFPEAYGQAGRALAILAAAEFLHTTLGPNEQALIAYGATRIHFFSYFAAAVTNIALNAILIPRMGITGAATATGISLIVLNLFASGFLYIRFRVHPFGRNNVMPLVVTFTVSGALYPFLRSMVIHSKWLILACFLILFIVSVGSTLITRSYSEEDLIVYRAIVARLKSMRKQGEPS